MLLLFLSLSVLVQAKTTTFSKEDLKFVNESTNELGAVYLEADSRLPPCEGHRRFREAVLRLEPPRSCERARKIYDSIYEAGNSIRSSCENLSDYMQEALQSRSSCVRSNPEGDVEMLEKLTQLKRNSQNGITTVLSDNLEDIAFDSEGYPTPKGEFANVKCAVLPMIYLQYREKELSLMNIHFEIAVNEAFEFCADSESYEPSYLEFLRYGEEGDPAKKQAAPLP
jgi:hypothetical protein